jgi:hypothetical protein
MLLDILFLFSFLFFFFFFFLFFFLFFFYFLILERIYIFGLILGTRIGCFMGSMGIVSFMMLMVS